jgi:tRNA 2-thiocytidine biosynthesis protein TtcA
VARAAAGGAAGLQPRPGPAELPQAHPAGLAERHGIAHRIEYRDTYSIVTDKLPEGATYCSLCSRLRRGHLYRIAREEGCSALVLGHHREDSLETFFMNLFHGGRLAAMPPKLMNDEGDVDGAAAADLLRRADLAKFAEHMAVPDHPLRSLRLAGRAAAQRHEGDARRHRARMPGRKDVMIRALGNVGRAICSIRNCSTLPPSTPGRPD